MKPNGESLEITVRNCPRQDVIVDSISPTTELY